MNMSNVAYSTAGTPSSRSMATFGPEYGGRFNRNQFFRKKFFYT
jgi:hypothetical protein